MPMIYRVVRQEPSIRCLLLWDCKGIRPSLPRYLDECSRRVAQDDLRSGHIPESASYPLAPAACIRNLAPVRTGHIGKPIQTRLVLA